jgi:hypothetical protein
MKMEETTMRRTEQIAIQRFVEHLKKEFQKDKDISEAELAYDMEVIDGAFGSYGSMPPDEWKKSMADSSRGVLEACPDADPQVIGFITQLMSHATGNEAEYEVLRSTFRAGYCWHFAHILKDAFGRGEVCWAAPFGHFVWVDEDGVPYDAEGVNQGEQDYHIPESYLGHYLSGFTHVPGERVDKIDKAGILSIIQRYEDDKGLPHKDIDW